MFWWRSVIVPTIELAALDAATEFMA